MIFDKKFGKSMHVKKLEQKKRLVLCPTDVRRLDKHDYPEIEKLVDETTYSLFGNKIDIATILYPCLVTLGIFTPHNELTGVLALADHPNIPAIPKWAWSVWLHNLYSLDAAKPSNTRWVHLLLWNNKYASIFLKPLLHVLFREFKYLEFVLLALPPGVGGVNFLSDVSTRVMPIGYVNPRVVTTMCLMARQHFVTKYKIRRAVEEDNDDLVPLIEAYSERLQEMYGEFYLAELLTRFNNSTRQIIVAEHGEFAVAVLILNSVVNYELLNEEFELAPFHGLKTPNPNDTFCSIFNRKHGTETTTGDGDELISLYSDTAKPFRQKKVSAYGQTSTSTGSDSTMISHIRSPNVVHSAGEQGDSGDSSGDDDDEESDIFEESSSEFSIAENFSDSSLDILNLSPEMQENVVRATSDTTSLFSAVLLDDYSNYVNKDKGVRGEDKKSKYKYRPRTDKLPVFYGNENAFALEVIASNPEHVHCLPILLEAAFECFPQRDYCVMTMPSTQIPQHFFRTFIRVPPRIDGSFPHELYILHRNSIQAKMLVRMGVPKDKSCVEEFLSFMMNPGSLMAQYEQSVCEENPSLWSFVLLADKQIVGLAIISQNVDVDYVFSHYQLYEWLDEKRHKNDDVGVLENLILLPIFQRFSRYFLREIHRMSDFGVLLYSILPNDTASLKDHYLQPNANILQSCIPVLPRKLQGYDLHNLEDYPPANATTRIDPQYSVFLSMSRLSCTNRLEINHRIVVVGAGETATAFLEALIRPKYSNLMVTFTNVTVISPHGLIYQKSPNRVRDMMFIHKGYFSNRYMDLIALKTHMNSVTGVMSEINRREKYVMIDDKYYLPYDYLILMCGEQYQKPVMKAQKAPVIDFPTNMFIINTEMDAVNALNKMTSFDFSEPSATTPNPKKFVIVYGHHLSAHCCIAALMEYGISPNQICFIDPVTLTVENEANKTYDRIIYHDPEIEEAVMNSIRMSGITMHTGYQFLEWVQDPQSHLITNVKFESRYFLLDLDCVCIFMYTHKTISTKTFLAINKAGLVFDGRLVIDTNGRTNDPNIYAAGTVTKYSRRYHADHMSHLYFNPVEVGQRLGEEIRKLLIPEEYQVNLVAKKQYSKEFPISLQQTEMSIKKYSMPLVTSCILPGGLHYLTVCKPGKQETVELAMNKDDFGQLLVTGDFKMLERQGYFRLHLNLYGKVETVTCLSRTPIEVNNLVEIWGKHEKLLNCLQSRFELMMITDLFEFFKEPWVCAIYYDKFKTLLDEIGDILAFKPLACGETIVEKAHDYYEENEYKLMTRDQKVRLRELLNESGHKNEIELMIMNFIQDNSDALSMYAYPSLIRLILHDYMKSPMFSTV